MNKNELYRKIPKVDVLLKDEKIQTLTAYYGRSLVLEAIREEVESLRETIRFSDGLSEVTDIPVSLPERIEKRLCKITAPSMKRVINATGTVLHTNLGRAPIDREHSKLLAEIVSGYSNLEYDLETGKRAERYAHFEELLCRITGAEAAMAVNNNAAAVLLALSTLCKGGEVLVSRGELVEIGGKFRIPDVCAQSGALLREVGTTNRTRLSDYEDAITDQTGAVMKVHTSNYRIVGFTESTDSVSLTEMAHSHGIPVIEDLGSGVLVDLTEYGLPYEPTVQESLRAGIDVVCFSGDKLLGGPQAGIILGKKEYILQMKKHPLTRALRVDKYTVAALELMLREYLCKEHVREKLPVLRMLSETEDSLKKKAAELAGLLRQKSTAADINCCRCCSMVGGGSLPTEKIPGFAVAIKPREMSTAALERKMRSFEVPIVCRVSDDSVLLDVRTIEEEDFRLIAKMLGEVLS